MKTKKERLYDDVDYLASIRPYRNYKNKESLRTAARYIEGQFEQLELPVSHQQWEARGDSYENIIASFHPQKERRLIVGAHYDVYKQQPGADDNASGIAGLLETARMAVGNDINIDYGIDFVAYCLEEPPFFRTKKMGSYIHAQSVCDSRDDIIGMLSFEMIGYFADKFTKEKSEFPPSLAVSGLRKYDLFNKKVAGLMKQYEGIGTKRISFANEYRNAGPSDHRNYWAFDIPAVMVIGASKNPNYHQQTDTIDTLNFELMTEAVNSCAEAILGFEGEIF